MTNPFLKSLRHNIETILESDLWKEVKPSSPRAAEYFVQAIGDMNRCLGNFDRMEMVEGEAEDAIAFQETMQNLSGREILKRVAEQRQILDGK